MRIPIANEGYMFIIPLALLTAGLLAYSLYWLALVAGVLFLYVIYFFRDPEREITTEANAVVSPADGKIVEITIEEDPFMGKSLIRLRTKRKTKSGHIHCGRVESDDSRLSRRRRH